MVHWVLRPEKLMLSGELGCYSIASSPLISPLLGGQGSLSRSWPSGRGLRLTYPLLAHLSLDLDVLFHTRQGFESLAAWASRSQSIRRSSSSCEGTSQGYVWKPSSQRERDIASWCHTSSILAGACFIPRSWHQLHHICFYTSWSLRHPDVSPIHWSDYTRYGNTLLEGVCIRLTWHLHNHDMTHVMNMKEVVCMFMTTVIVLFAQLCHF